MNFHLQLRLQTMGGMNEYLMAGLFWQEQMEIGEIITWSLYIHNIVHRRVMWFKRLMNEGKQSDSKSAVQPLLAL